MPVKWGTNPHDHDLYAILADAAAQQRDLAAIRQFGQLAEELAVRDDHKLYRAIAHRALAVGARLAGEYNDAETRLQHALKLFQTLGTRWQIGRTWVEWGELQNALGHTAETRDGFTRALIEFDALGAVVDASRTRARRIKLESKEW